MEKIEKTLEDNVIYDGKIIKVNNDKVICPNGQIATREIVHHRGGVCVLAFVDNKIVFVKQYRYAYQQEMLELPAGKLEKGENAYDAGIRELEEEVGLKADKLINLGVIYPTCGYSDEKIYLYLANNVTKVDRHLDPDEFIDVYYYSVDDVLQMIKDNKINDAKTICALMKYINLNK